MAATAHNIDIGFSGDGDQDTTQLVERLVSSLESSTQDNLRLRNERKALVEQQQALLRREMEMKSKLEAIITRLKLMEQA